MDTHLDFFDGHTTPLTASELNRRREILHALINMQAVAPLRLSKEAGGFVLSLHSSRELFLGKAQSGWELNSGDWRVSVKHCMKRNGDDEIGDAFYVYLMTTNGEHPNVRSGKILQYMFDIEGAACAVVAGDGVLGKSIRIWHGAPADLGTERPGWAFCNGQTVGSVTTPDLRDRFVLFYKDDVTGVMASTGGYKWHGMTENNHPDHVHHSHPVDVAYENKGRTDGNYSIAATVGVCTGRAQTYKDCCGADLVQRHGGIENPWPSDLDPVAEAHDNADTDNRPPFMIEAPIMRVN